MAIPFFGIASLINSIEQMKRLRENGISEDDYNRQMAELRTGMNTPEYAAKFENNLRDMNYGTTEPIAPWYVGPQTEDSERFKLNETMLPRRLETLPVESNFTPEQLQALRSMFYGNAEQTGPQQEDVASVRNSDFSPTGGGDFMPQGGGKEAFSASMEDIEQYLRGGVVGRRRA